MVEKRKGKKKKKKGRKIKRGTKINNSVNLERIALSLINVYTLKETIWYSDICSDRYIDCVKVLSRSLFLLLLLVILYVFSFFERVNQRRERERPTVNVNKVFRSHVVSRVIIVAGGF